MTNNNIVIEVEKLSKSYRLGLIGHGTLYRDLQSWWAKLRGQEDPNSPVYPRHAEAKKSPANEYFKAIDNISFNVEKGDILGIIGRNGAGKSTLLKILSQITMPSSGEIRIKGRIASLLEVGTGFHSELTGRENVYLNGTILGMTRKEIDEKFDEIVSFSELEQFIDTPVKRYSSGMIVRLAFSVAAHLEAEILLVDEVLAVGDLNFRKKCLGKMRDISRNSERTVLFVSHDMTAIQNICTKGLLISKGKIEYMGGSEEAVRKYISGTGEQKKTSKWTPQKSAYPFSEIIRPKQFYIETEDTEIANDVIFGNQQYFIKIEVELIQPDPRLILLVAFYSSEGSLLFTTDIHDKGQINFSDFKKGTITFSVPMPSDLFLNSSYEIELMACLHHVGWVLPPDNETRLSFDFIIENDLNPYAGENRLGQLAPKIDWIVENNV